MDVDTIQVTIGRTKLAVPVFRDEETTRALVAGLNARLEHIEKTSRVIDTRVSLLLTAYECAVDAEVERTERQEDRASVERALTRIEQALRDTIERHRPRA